MKPSIFRLALVLVLVLMALPGIADAQDTPVLGAIKIIEPNLFMVEVGADSARPVYDLTSFDAGETLSTDETGVALITWFYDGTESVLGQNGSVTLNAFTGSNASTWEVNMTLNAGHRRAAIGPNGPFHVYLPPERAAGPTRRYSRRLAWSWRGSPPPVSRRWPTGRRPDAGGGNRCFRFPPAGSPTPTGPRMPYSSWWGSGAVSLL